MRAQRRLPALRRAALTVLAVLVAVAALVTAGPSAARLREAATAPRRLAATQGADALAVSAAGALAWAALAWLATAVLLLALSRLPGAIGRASGAVTRVAVPAAARRALAGALGLSLVTGAGASLLAGS